VSRETAATQARYDAMEWVTEQSAFQGWRADLWLRVRPGHILEVGGAPARICPTIRRCQGQRFGVQAQVLIGVAHVRFVDHHADQRHLALVVIGDQVVEPKVRGGPSKASAQEAARRGRGSRRQRNSAANAGSARLGALT
jgi:hypothetical protein